MKYVVPVLIVAVLMTGLIKRIDVYDCFICGVKKALPLAVSLLPCLVATFVMVNALRQSGLGVRIIALLAPPFELMGIPSELVELMLLRPFSGSGSLAILSEVYAQYGVDSYIGRAASVIMGSSETVFYVASVYFSQTKVTKTGFAVPIALFCNLIGGVCACLLCRVL